MKNIISSALIFTSGFLVLAIQLILGKSLLPFYGGSPNTWISSLAFFQCFLSVGYLYSYINQKYLNFNWQIKTHFILSLTSIVFLYFSDFDYRATSVFLTLSVIIGVPYLVLTTLSPIIQSWYASYFKESPYYLYIFSNLGTFTSLIAYPLLIEPNIDINFQFDLFKYLFIGLFFIYALISIFLINKTNKLKYDKKEIKKSTINFNNKIKIILFAFIPSALLGVITTKVTTDISPMPLLWVIPLGLYFLSFSIAFYDKFKIKDNFIYVMFAIMAITIFNIFNNKTSSFSFFVFYGALFILSIYYHKKIYDLKPNSEDLPLFYFMMSIGGFLGGFFTGIISPYIFNDYYEFYIIIIISILCIRFNNKNMFNKYSIPLMLSIIFIMNISYKLNNDESNVILKERTFFGVYKVKYSDGVNYLIHGTTLHGVQEKNNNTPLSYYSLENTISLGINSLKDYSDVAVIGLGTGALSCAVKENTNLDYFEIDQEIINIAKNDKYFSFISSCKNKKTELILGDARIQLKNIEKKYDIIVVDAFSSDSIPSHLLTKEAFELYIDKLKSTGIIVFHISNRHIDLEIPISNIASSLQKESKICKKYKKDFENKYSNSSSTIVIGNNLNNLNECYNKSKTNSDRIWTDNFSSILKYIK